MAFDLGSAIVTIGAKNDLSHGVDAAKRSVGELGSSLKEAAIGVGAFIGAFLGIKESISLFFEHEQAVIGLSAALETTHQSVKNLLPDYEKFADDVQLVTRVGNDEAMQMLSQAANFGFVGDQAKEATRAAIGLSASFSQLDRGTALKLLGQAAQGSTEALARYIPQLRGVTDQAQAMKIITEAASKGLQQEEARTNTTSGGWEQLKNALSDAGKTLGELLAGNGQGLMQWLVGMVKQFTEGIQIVIKWKNDMMASFSSATESAGGFFGFVKGMFSWFTTMVKLMIFSVGNWELSWAVLKESAVNAFRMIVARAEWFGGAIIQVGGFFFRNWKEIFSDIFNFGVTVFTNLIENIKRLFVGIWDWVSSGGKSGFQKGFVGLADGFKSSLKEKLVVDDFVPPELQHEAADRFGAAWKMYEDAGKEAAKNTGKALEEAKKNIVGTPVHLDMKPAAKDASKKTSDAGSFKGIADAWKDIQSKISKAEDDVPKQQLKAQQQGLQKQDEANALLKQIAGKDPAAVLA